MIAAKTAAAAPSAGPLHRFDFEAAADRVALTGASRCFDGDPDALNAAD